MDKNNIIIAILKGKQKTTKDNKKFDSLSIEFENGNGAYFSWRDSSKVDKKLFKAPFAKVIEVDKSKLSFKEKNIGKTEDGKDIVITTVFADFDDIKISENQDLLAERAMEKIAEKFDI